jgi:hypothetical protein
MDFGNHFSVSVSSVLYAFRRSTQTRGNVTAILVVEWVALLFRIRDWVLFVALLSPFKQISEQYLTLSHNSFLP